VPRGFESTQHISIVIGPRGDILAMLKWAGQHNRLLFNEPQGFLNFC
jgi:hypothetical protein